MLVSFERQECTDVEVAGGKGASLARMTSLGMPVPPGFVVPADVLEAALADTVAAIRDVLARGEQGDDLAVVAEEAIALVRAADSGGAFPREIAEAYARLGDGVPVAVRSSATAEDSEAASFAGQQATYLHVEGVDDIVERIRDCWCSFFTERALFYRSKKGSLSDLGMAVVVQRMVEPDVAGVMSRSIRPRAGATAWSSRRSSGSARGWSPDSSLRTTSCLPATGDSSARSSPRSVRDHASP